MAKVFQVRGFRELEQAMKEFPLKLQRRAVTRAVRQAALVVAAEVRREAPRKTGALRRAVSIRKVRYPDGVKFIIGIETGSVRNVRDGQNLVWRRVGSSLKARRRKATMREKRGEDPFYYRFQEAGFTAVGTHRGGPGRKIPGRAFLARSLQRTSASAIERMRVELSEQIDKITRAP